MLWLIIVWFISGAIAGYLARLLVPGRDPMGCLGTVALGIAGSFVGGTLAVLIFQQDFELSPAGIIGSVIGAILILLFLRARRRR